ncbi:serine/threonine-protein kinase SRK2B [Quercus suber]|uniref:serine/threonine-protein kinase SRK2B n=1 Tax=Quercus suber TaxID=58331 RepID=UPI0032DE80A0
MAPEVREREYNGKLADLWSYGVILYNMLVGEHPNYRPNDTGETSNVYETNACPFSLPDSLSLDSKDLLARMLVVDHGKRITIEDVNKHQWFKERELPEAIQVTKENPRLSHQSDEEIEKIVEEAKSVEEE